MGTPSPGRPEPAELRAALDRFVDVARGIEQASGAGRLSVEELTELGGHGLTLLEGLEGWVEALARNLPGDAPRFFQEGMGQMEALDYPPHVRAVMERYYHAWSARTVH